jgi:hypothetical protein
MKISELIKKLQHIVNTKGDKDLYFTVKDSYSIYGEEMQLSLKVGETTGLPSDFEGFTINGDRITIKFSLSNYDNKKSKITFRK